MKPKKMAPKFPEYLFQIQGCEIHKLAFLSTMPHTQAEMAVYYNIFSLETEVVNVKVVDRNEYFSKEFDAIAQLAALIQRKLNYYSSRLEEIKKQK